MNDMKVGSEVKEFVNYQFKFNSNISTIIYRHINVIFAIANQRKVINNNNEHEKQSLYVIIKTFSILNAIIIYTSFVISLESKK